MEKVPPGELVAFETIDALGGQVKDEDTVLDEIDWGKVNGSTGPVYVEDARPGDTLVVEVLDIKVDDRSVMVVVPGHGALGEKKTFKPKVKIDRIKDGFIYFNGIKVKARPMIGTIGVAPASEEIPLQLPRPTWRQHGCEEAVRRNQTIPTCIRRGGSPSNALT